jgi:hypothetical protein
MYKIRNITFFICIIKVRIKKIRILLSIIVSFFKYNNNTTFYFYNKSHRSYKYFII